MAVDQTQYQNAMTDDPTTGKPMPKQGAHITGSDVQQPVEIQGVYTEQEKTLTAASVGAGATVNFTSNVVAMISDKGNFTRFGGLCVGSANHTFTVSALPSPDGTTIGASVFSSAGASTTKVITPTDSPLDYLVYQITNSDASSRTYDVWTRKFN